MSRTYPPGPKGVPILGNLPAFQRDRLGFLTAASRYGDMTHLHAGRLHIYLLNQPNLVRTVLVEQSDRFFKDEFLLRNTRLILGNGLLTSNGAFHRRQRRLMQPAFLHSRILTYGETMVTHTLRMMERWEHGQQRDIADEMMRLALGIVAKTLYDADVSGTVDEIGKAITTSVHFVGDQMGSPLRAPKWLPTALNRGRWQATGVLQRIIMDIINQRRASGEDNGDFLSMLVMAQDEDGSRMTDRQIYDEAVTLFIAGHETTAIAMAWAFYLLGQHPQVEARLEAELDAVLEGRPPAASDLPNLPYTEMVVKEVLRLYPPAWIIGRNPMEDMMLGGYDIRKSSLLIISPYTLGRDGNFFEEPQRFWPERFSPQREGDIPRYTYIPFGVGPRVCIGQGFAMMEAQLVLSTVLQRYRLRLVPDQQIEPEPLITLRPKHGILMTLEAREGL